MVFFLYGPDTYRSSQKVRELKNKFLKEVDASGLNLTFLDGNKITFSDLQSAVATPPFLARKRMVVINDLLAKDGEKKTNQELAKQIIELLDNEKLISEILLIFLEHDTPDQRKTLFKRLNQEQYAQEFPILKPTEVSRWIKAEVKSRGSDIAADAIEQLVIATGGDLWQTSTEIDKLIAYAAGRGVTLKDVQQLVKGKYDDNIFAFVDAIAGKNFKVAYRLLSDQLQSGAHELYLLSMLIRQFRILLQIKDLLLTRGTLTSGQIASELSLHPFVAQKSLAQVRNFTLPRLKQIYRHLLDADIKIKTSYADAKVLFALLLDEIMK